LATEAKSRRSPAQGFGTSPFVCAALLAALGLNQANAANLLFKSGFEGGVSLEAPAGFGAMAGTQLITGTDSVTGYSWPAKIWNAGYAALQINVGKQVTPEESKNYIQNEIQTVTGHDGTPTRALFQAVLRRGAQDPYYIVVPQEQGDLYVKYWVKFPPDLAQSMGPRDWRALFEWKTDGDYRTILDVYTDADGHPFWHVQGDNNANGGLPFQQFWAVDDRDVPVLQGDWFSVEVFWHRSGDFNGRIWIAINGHTIVDRRGSNIGVKGAPINRIMIFQNYGGTQNPSYQWVDDLEVWDGMPKSALLKRAGRTGVDGDAPRVPKTQVSPPIRTPSTPP
jgi:hypothetical protein